VDELRLLAAAGEVERCHIAMAGDGRSDDQILNELDALSHTLYQPHTKRRTASLTLPRVAGDANAGSADAARAEARPLSCCLSMSP